MTQAKQIIFKANKVQVLVKHLVKHDTVITYSDQSCAEMQKKLETFRDCKHPPGQIMLTISYNCPHPVVAKILQKNFLNLDFDPGPTTKLNGVLPVNHPVPKKSVRISR